MFKLVIMFVLGTLHLFSDVLYWQTNTSEDVFVFIQNIEKDRHDVKPSKDSIKSFESKLTKVEYTFYSEMKFEMKKEYLSYYDMLDFGCSTGLITGK